MRRVFGEITMKVLTKNFLIGISLAVLFSFVCVSLPQVDSAEADVYFYFKHLPTLIYYAVLILSITTAFVSKSVYLRAFSIFIFAFLIVSPPDVMLANSWLTDTYPFASEAVYVVRNGRIGEFHYLSENPSLGLFLGSFLMATGIDAFLLMKIYQTLIVSILVAIMCLMSKYLGINGGESYLMPMFFLAIMWPNVFHLSRQSFGLIFYFSSWLFLVELVLHRYDRRIFLLLSTQIFLMVVSHPATPIYFVANVMMIAIVGSVFKVFKRKDMKTFVYGAAFCTAFWFLWNSVTDLNNIQIFRNIFVKLYNSLMEEPQHVSGVSRIFSGYTTTYSLLIDVRLVLTIAVFACSIFLPLIVYVHCRNPNTRKILVILAGWNLSNLLSAVPLLYAGLPYFDRPVLFSFISWAPIGELLYQVLKRSSPAYSKLRKVAKMVFVIFLIVVPSMLIPIIKYSPLPFLHPPTRELSAIFFADVYSREKYTLLEFTAPWGYSYIRGLGVENITGRYVLSGYEFSDGKLNFSRINSQAIVLTYRLICRDAFMDYNPSMLQVVKNITDSNAFQEKIYDSGWPYWMITFTSRQAGSR